MSAVTVTATIGTTCHYVFTPEPTWNVSGLGMDVLDIVRGWVTEASDQTPATLTLTLDDSTTWDVDMSFLGAEPIRFSGLNVAGGGDLFVLLNAQGWAV